MIRSNFDIVVLGGGPAGASAALGLSRLGYSVAVVAQPRTFAAMEGISQRVMDGLIGSGLGASLDGLPPQSPRQVSWNGETNAANVETLVERAGFDQKILAVLKNSAVDLFEARVSAVQETDAGWRVECTQDSGVFSVTAGFLVEARGRSAPASGIERFKGPDTLSLLHYWHGDTCQPYSAVESFDDGWAWMAIGADGRRYLQLTLDAQSTRLPAKKDLPEFCAGRIQGLKQASRFIDNAIPTQTVVARTSASVLHQEVVGQRWIRVGDAAMAVDPLSGNGVFQALSSALIAPAVVNTLLQHPEASEIAQDFYQRRTSELFYRFSRIGRDFYRMESRWPEQQFWRARAHWPDAIESHAVVEPGSWSVSERPVVVDNRIRVAEVLITPDQPLGIWHLQGVELAPVMVKLSSLSPGNTTDDINRIAGQLQLSVQQVLHVYRWALSQRLLPSFPH